MELDSVIYKIPKGINNNLIKKEKGSKNLIYLEKTVEDIKFLYSNRMKDTLCSLWSIPISKTIANTIIEYYFSTMKLKYIPYEVSKSLSFYSKKRRD